ncbi:hypothetical protein Godav_008718 [Gossypium davidsonii]|uniref:Protein kinase domain-containing protein n=1 Tax=Gossypium davidsonii TaxID=34287 RepID=A0A7J8SBF5_GOSDV|nr:hypothetical protein [Gossypium davidsonii]
MGYRSCPIGPNCKHHFALINYQQWKHLKSLISGPLTSFSYSELSLSTTKFTERIGGGGFGTIYKGVLKDGTMVAVKQLENTGQGIDEFLAKVDTIRNIHHVNLVKLIGFYNDKRQRVLVYEYMSREIVHLDVKPQNILLDDSFNAKISDFGLSKLINRNESQVVTQMRGTLGYLTLEWQHSRITVKADIYSFGIVVLKVITGRMVLDYSQPDSDVCLLKLVKKKGQEKRLSDIIDLTREDVQQHIETVNAMIMLELWCVNEDHTRQPSIHSVVKLLEEEKMMSVTTRF